MQLLENEFLSVELREEEERSCVFVYVYRAGAKMCVALSTGYLLDKHSPLEHSH